jgi:hypothetical protein
MVLHLSSLLDFFYGKIFDMVKKPFDLDVGANVHFTILCHFDYYPQLAQF